MKASPTTTVVDWVRTQAGVALYTTSIFVRPMVMSPGLVYRSNAIPDLLYPSHIWYACLAETMPPTARILRQAP